MSRKISPRFTDLDHRGKLSYGDTARAARFLRLAPQLAGMQAVIKASEARRGKISS
jgi:hypothetical protein